MMRAKILVLTITLSETALLARCEAFRPELKSVRLEISRDGDTRLVWQTAADAGTLYYNVFRQQPGSPQWVKINDYEIIASNSITGGNYSLHDPNANLTASNCYLIDQIDQQGNERPVGRYRPAAIRLPENAAATSRESPAQKPRAAGPSPPARPRGINSLALLNGNTFVKITTANSGLQAIPITNLSALLGLNVNEVQVAAQQNQLQMSTAGQAVTYLMSPDGSNILFYAETHVDNYSTNNVYWLTSGNNQPLGYLAGGCPAPTSATIWYPCQNHFEVNAIYVNSLPLGAEDDPWMWQQLIALPIASYNTFTWPVITDHVSGQPLTQGQLGLNLWGGIATTHTVEVLLNSSTLLGTWSWYGLVPTNFTANIPVASLNNGQNQITLKALGSGSPISAWYLNNFSFTYPRAYYSLGGSLDFTANSNSIITVDGFSSTNIMLLDVSNPKQPLLITNACFDRPATTDRVSFVPASPVAHVVAFQPDLVNSLPAISLAQTAGLSSPTNMADYVIISPASLLPAATNLMRYRQQTGLRVVVAPLDEVYNEFAYGFPTPHALQALLACAWTNWLVAPHYLALLGRGTYDFLDLKQAHDNLTPPMMVSTPSGVFASDSIIGSATSNRPPQVAVGRLPGLTTNDLLTLIGKIERYETANPSESTNGLLIADVADSAGNFSNDMAQISAVLAGKFSNVLLVSTNAGNSTPLHSQILTQWNAGVDLVTYNGHGALTQLGAAGYLTTYDTTNALLLNSKDGNRCPFFSAMTCVAGEYSIPATPCLGEQFLQMTAGGAIAFLGATGLSLDGEATEFDLRLTQLLRGNTQLALGDAFRQALSDHISLDAPSVPAWIYNFLGDPATIYNIVRDLTPLNINSISLTNFTWSGSLPPYQVQSAGHLGGPWQAFGPATLNYYCPVTNAPTTTFFRVAGSK